MKHTFFRLLLFVVLCTPFAFADGVTILTHGWNPNLAGRPAWLESMRDTMAAEYLHNEQRFGVITVTKPSSSLVVTCNPWNVNLSTGTTGEIIIILDWSAIANHLNSAVSAQQVAAAVVDVLVTGQHGERPLAELPLHLIGHSRGGGLVCELARLLGERGIVVDHVTPLDPHPLTSADPQPAFPLPPVIDTPASIYENVVFADVYSQLSDYPQGQYLTGAYNRLWGAMPGGYFNNTAPDNAYANHRNIYLLYQGTMTTNTPFSNGEATMGAAERTNWFNAYETNGLATGFYYSRMDGRGTRISPDRPNGADTVAAGYISNAVLHGAGSRASLSWSAAVWPNIAACDLLTNDVKLSHGAHTISLNDTLHIRYTGLDYDSAGSLSLLLDSDYNPYNTNQYVTITNTAYAASGGAYFQHTITWNVPALTAGCYTVCAEISDGSHTRYYYADASLSVVPEPGYLTALLCLLMTLYNPLRSNDGTT